MKERIQGAIIGIALTIALIGTISFASQRSDYVERFFRDIKITINGSILEPKDANGSDVEPFIIDGTTYLPLRAISEALDLKVNWNEETNTVIISSIDGETEAKESAIANETNDKNENKKENDNTNGKTSNKQTEDKNNYSKKDNSSNKTTTSTLDPRNTIGIMPNLGNLSIVVGTTIQEEITGRKGLEDELKWKSSNPEVASVDNKGLVKGLKAGEAEITAYHEDGNKNSVKVRVVDPKPTFKEENLNGNHKNGNKEIEIKNAKMYIDSYSQLWIEGEAELLSGSGGFYMKVKMYDQDGYYLAEDSAEIMPPDSKIGDKTKFKEVVFISKSFSRGQNYTMKFQ